MNLDITFAEIIADMCLVPRQLETGLFSINFTTQSSHLIDHLWQYKYVGDNNHLFWWWAKTLATTN